MEHDRSAPTRDKTIPPGWGCVAGTILSWAIVAAIVLLVLWIT